MRLRPFLLTPGSLKKTRLNFLKTIQEDNFDMGFQQKNVSGQTEDLVFFRRRVSREPIRTK